MFKLPKKFVERAQTRMRHFKNVAASHRQKDVSEADTVTLVKDILSDVLGYDKYTELTSEQQIRGTFCDLAVKIDGKIRFLIEVKSAGSNLSDSHLRQALNYGSNQGIEWVILTNAIEWSIYKIKFGQPVSYDHISTFSIIDFDPKIEEHLARLFIIAREGINSDAIQLFHQHSLLINKYTLTQLVLSDSILNQVRRELRRIFPDVKVDTDTIQKLLVSEMLKREVLEGDKVKEAKLAIRKAQQKQARMAAKNQSLQNSEAG